MEPSIRIENPEYLLYEKNNYEPILLECLNHISFFIDESGGGLSAPKSESYGECDAIGRNDYSIDFKCLISEEGAKNKNDTSLTREKLCPGVTAITPSKASLRGVSSLPFPNIWGFLVSHGFSVNDNDEIALVDKTDKYMKATVKSLNKIIRTKKNLLIFHPCRLIIQDFHTNPTEVLCNRAKEALSIISKARANVSSGYDTYYALLMNDTIALLSADFTPLGCILLTSLNSWQKLRQG